MADPRRVRPDEIEILVARELRKSGLALSPPRTIARRALSKESGESEYSVELSAVVAHDVGRRDVLIECRNERRPTGVDAVRALAARLQPRAAPPAPTGPERPPAPRRIGIMFATSGYDPAAVREALASGITLLAITDGAAAFRRSQWSMGEQIPAWVPEYMAELVDLDPAGSVRRQLITTGMVRLRFES